MWISIRIVIQFGYLELGQVVNRKCVPSCIGLCLLSSPPLLLLLVLLVYIEKTDLQLDGDDVPFLAGPTGILPFATSNNYLPRVDLDSSSRMEPHTYLSGLFLLFNYVIFFFLLNSISFLIPILCSRRTSNLYFKK